jgi:glycosyltransferase involved in cell wall biosynthesis
MLRSALEALTLQIRPADEVIVVDNDSRDETRDVAMSFADLLPLAYVFEPRRGVAIARNAGVRVSTGDVIAFTDDDCVPDPSWLLYLEMPLLRDPEIGMVAGEVLPFASSGNLIERFCRADHETCEEALR